MLKIILLVFIQNSLYAGTIQNSERVNHHLQRTQAKIQLMRQRTSLDNRKSAPPVERSPTYQDPGAFRSYGVEMPKHLPFDDLDLDHLEETEPSLR